MNVKKSPISFQFILFKRPQEEPESYTKHVLYNIFHYLLKVKVLSYSSAFFFFIFLISKNEA
jgi:hypothetical protein